MGAKPSRARIRTDGNQALVNGDPALATLCEIALGGDGPLNKLAYRQVVVVLEKQ
jgi:hypothetical protein